jgi:hypothetical protein
MRLFERLGENQRMKVLFAKYRETLRTGASDQQARFAVLAELRMRAGLLGDQIRQLDTRSQQSEIDALFSPLKVNHFHHHVGKPKPLQHNADGCTA